MEFRNAAEAAAAGRVFGKGIRVVLDAVTRKPGLMVIEVAAETGEPVWRTEALLAALHRVGKVMSTGTPARWHPSP